LEFERHYNQALSFAYQNRLRESIPHFLEARKIEPRHPDFQRTLFPILVTLLQEDTAAVAAAELPPLSREPLVSVIVPTRNRPAMLRDALQSILNQTYQNREIVVVNDGGEPVAPVLQSTRVIDMKTSVGPAAARNTAIAVAKGEVLAFLDDDDRYMPDHLERLVAALRAGNAAFAYTTAELVREKIAGGRRSETSRQIFMGGLRYSRLLLLVRNFIPINTWGVRREVFAKAGGFDEALHYLEDWDFLLRLSTFTPCAQVDAVTVEYRVTDERDDSLSKRHGHKPAVERIYARHQSAEELVKLARELYLESL
jgi:glycosyltransferase involved in cell wall biosynthesis